MLNTGKVCWIKPVGLREKRVRLSLLDSEKGVKTKLVGLGKECWTKLDGLRKKYCIKLAGLREKSVGLSLLDSGEECIPVLVLKKLKEYYSSS